MKFSRQVVLFFVVLTAVIALDITTAAAKDCPSGYSWVQSTSRCEAQPWCPGGTYDSSTKQCLANADFTCSATWYTLVIAAHTVSCTGPIYCDCGGTFYDDGTNWGCDAGPPPCSCGYSLTICDPKIVPRCGSCLKFPVCPGGGVPVTSDSGNDYCQGILSFSCPTGYSYWAYMTECSMNPKCPSNGYFDALNDICFLPAYPDPNNDKGTANAGGSGGGNGGTNEGGPPSPGPGCSGGCCSSGPSTGVGFPVSVGNGKVFTSETDFSMSGLIPLNFTRFYNSKTTNLAKGFGVTWGHNFDTSVTSYFGTSIYQVVNPDGSIFYYNDTNGDGVYEADIPKGETSKLIRNTDHTFARIFKNGSSEEFNASGYMTAVADRNGNMTTLTRDSGNKLTSITDPSGRMITIAYNASNYISQITLPDGKVMLYTYASGALQKVTYPDSSYRTYEYSGYNLTGIRNENGNYIEKHTYDSQGRGITSSVDGTNELLTLNYTSDTQTTVTDSLGRVTTYTIDKTGGASHATAISGPGCKGCSQSNVSYTYDGNLNITSLTDANGVITAFTYDTQGNLLTKTEAYGTPLQRTTTYTYNQFGEILTMTDPVGNTTYYSYDAWGNLLSTTDAQGNVTSYAYDNRGLKISMTDPEGNTTTYNYDQYGNLASVTDPLNNVTSYTYDTVGRILSVTDPNNSVTSTGYDARGRTSRVTSPKGGTTTYGYDPAGNTTAVVDALGNTTTYSYDTINRPKQVTDAQNHSINYSYDTLSRLTRMTDQLGNFETYTYDQFGNFLHTVADRKGQTTTYTYDLVNRLASASYADGSSTTYTYDILGRLTAVSDSIYGVITYTYSSMGCGAGCSGGFKDKITNETTPFGSVSYTYDSTGRRTSMTVAGQPPVNYTYDGNSRITGMNTTISGNALDFAFEYDALNRRTALTLPNGVTTSYGYDNGSHLLNLLHLDPANAALESITYTYDPNGNRTSMDRPGANPPTPLAASNILFNAANQMLTFNSGNITYDANGNMTSRANACGTTVYTWDSRNRLVAISGYKPDCSQLAASFTYDALGRRPQKTINGRTISYVYDGQDIVQEIENGLTSVNYIRTQNVDEPLARIDVAIGIVRYYHADALGSIIGLSNERGQEVTKYVYDAFGNVAISGEISDNSFQYTGRENDGTGLYYYRARYYSPELQRFISEDPVGLAGGINQYIYADNNPMNVSDPLGMMGIKPPPPSLGDFIPPISLCETPDQYCDREYADKVKACGLHPDWGCLDRAKKWHIQCKVWDDAIIYKEIKCPPCLK